MLPKQPINNVHYDNRNYSEWLLSMKCPGELFCPSTGGLTVSIPGVCVSPTTVSVAVLGKKFRDLLM